MRVWPYMQRHDDFHTVTGIENISMKYENCKKLKKGTNEK